LRLFSSCQFLWWPLLLSTWTILPYFSENTPQLILGLVNRGQ
jgi:hypothetical protein